MAHQVVNRAPSAGPGLKGILLGFFAAALLPVGVAALYRGDLSSLFHVSLAFFLLVAAAAVTRRGIAATAEYQRRSLSAAPPPYRLGGLLLATSASFVLAWSLNHYSLIQSLAFAIVTAAGYYLYYDLDPRKEKALEGLAGYSTAELMEIINEARGRIGEIRQQARTMGNTPLTAQVSNVTALADDVMDILEKNPKELRRARKFMTVYLDGARDVVTGYARMHDKTSDAGLHANFRDVLATIEKAFEQQRATLLSNDILDLDIQIEVLKKQMES